jgi:RimJ/RimL family protein N-acetyltransferase
VLRGERVALRAMERADLAAMEPWDHDPAEWPLVSEDPWLPRTLAEREAAYDAGELGRSTDRNASFVIEADGRPVGHVGLFGVDPHNRKARVGLGLAPDARGKGYASDALRVVLRYAFAERGLRRVQLEVLADNAPAVRCYEAVGFVIEGRLRDDAWVSGRWVDQLVMSVVATDPAARA